MTPTPYLRFIRRTNEHGNPVRMLQQWFAHASVTGAMTLSPDTHPTSGMWQDVQCYDETTGCEVR